MFYGLALFKINQSSPFSKLFLMNLLNCPHSEKGKTVAYGGRVLPALQLLKERGEGD